MSDTEWLWVALVVLTWLHLTWLHRRVFALEFKTRRMPGRETRKQMLESLKQIESDLESEGP